MDARMSGNQSGAEKDNRLLFGEQWILLFSKSKMALWKIGPIRSRIKNSRWRHPRKSAMLENNPPRLDGGLGSVSRISMATQITPRSRKKNVMQLQNRYLQCPVVLNDRGSSDKWPWWRLRDLGPSSDYKEAIRKHHGTMISTGTNQRKEIRMN